jgi:hypothetical protein
MPNEICILCGKETTVDINTHVDFRIGYIEGAGQLCISCYQKGNQSSRELITIPKDLVLNTPNDMELGSKVRQYYWNEYQDTEPPITNQWVCSLCGEDTSNVDYDYLAGADHISCILSNEMKVD